MARPFYVAFVVTLFVACAYSVPACDKDEYDFELTAEETETAAVTEPSTTVTPASATEPVYGTAETATVTEPTTTSKPAAATEPVYGPTSTGPSPAAASAPTSDGAQSPSVASSDPDDTTPRKASWKDHPMYRASPDSVVLPILAWYTTRTYAEEDYAVTARGRYTRQGARYSLHGRDIRDTPEAKAYHNYDLLHLTTQGHPGIDNRLEFELTRGAKMCVIMMLDGVSLDTDDVMTGPPGFESVGMVRWDDASEKPKNHKYSSYTGEPFTMGYMACKDMTAGPHKLPSADIFGAQHKVRGYNLIFSELDGSIPPLAPMPLGWTKAHILQHTGCPRELHEMWTVGPHDPNDPDIAGKQFASWHPQLDLVYNCYYMHEHGSFPGLAGYTARYDYTAWKNNRQDESNVGFKTYVIPAGKYWVVYTLHSDTSDFERVSKEFHTVVMAVTEMSTGKLMFEMSGKSSSGGAGARYESDQRPVDGPDMVPMGDAANKQRLVNMYATQRYRERVACLKRINLYNPENPRSDLIYSGDTPDDHMRGNYEGWTMRMLSGFCMNTTEAYLAAGPDVDIKNTHNGCKDDGCTQKLVLGRMRDGNLTPNTGTNRRVDFRKTSIGPQFCKHALPEPNAEGYHVFYTDQYAEELCDGPGVNCIMQRIHSSFEGVTLDNRYETSDVHGHFAYEPLFPTGFENIPEEHKQLRGIESVEGNLAWSVDDEL